MKTIKRLSVIQYQNSVNKNWKNKELFRLLRKTDLWAIAYKNIKYRKNNLESKDKILDKIELKKLEDIREEVIREKYQFTEITKIKILRSNDEEKELKFLSSHDRIVQEVIYLIFEAIYGPCDSNNSLNSKRNFVLHKKLKTIKSEFCQTKHIIKPEFSHIQPKTLLFVLSKKIQDIRFINLVNKFIKCGIFQSSNIAQSNWSNGQGNSLTLMLVDIYHTELDGWLQTKSNLLNRSRLKLRNQTNSEFFQRTNKLTKRMWGLNKKSEKLEIFLRKLRPVKVKKSSSNNLPVNFIQMKYTRFLDEWMIGLSGNKTLIKQLKIEVSEFFKKKLKQTVRSPQIKIVDLQACKVNFLKYEIYLSKSSKTSFCIHSNTIETLEKHYQLHLNIPMTSILESMKKNGFIKKSSREYRSTSKTSHIAAKDVVIVEYFRQVWKQLANYYSSCTSFTKLRYIYYLLHLSCAMTLSHRHYSSVNRVFTKHGKTLVIFDKKAKISFSY